ncbi:hypothetical protein XNW1_3700001 [Xenorhabdus nematophila str. Websteri]|nr:hypothetical protein XNW1_3700001 [Xenorhabdus nematophila str. Websteri]
MYITTDGMLQDLYIEVNDSSGHYKPDGGSCFKYVVDAFENIGINCSKSVTFNSRNIS